VSEIRGAQLRSWLMVCIATLLMYLSLIWFVRRVSATIATQKTTLVNQVEQLTEVLSQNAELHDRVRLATARNASLNEQFLRRISADLHDGPAQYLGLALLRLDYLFEHIEVCPQGKPVAESLEVVRNSLQGALQEVRTISSGLGLPELQALSLPAVIVRVVRAHEQRTQTKVDLTLSNLPEQASLSIKITLYRFIQEALNNAYRHAAGVGQQVWVSCDQATIAVEVCDQGCGFVSKPDLQNGTEHLGLAGMRERVASMGGQFTLDSTPGRGTRIGALLPLQTLEDTCA
jgi:signal transduction histidine kinase